MRGRGNERKRKEKKGKGRKREEMRGTERKRKKMDRGMASQSLYSRSWL
jgi:hypothetical protein